MTRNTRRWLLRRLLELGAALLVIGWLASYGLSARWAWQDEAPPADSSALKTPLASASPERLAPAPPTPALRLPVAGVAPDELTDTFGAPRSGGGAHEAIDILAPRGTPVLAAAPGAIARLHRSPRGGLSIYQLSRDSSRVYYYAHLARYAAGLAEGGRVRRGQVLGYVGHSGNAPESAPHLHFAIWRVEDPEQFWDGPPVNPYPLLRP